MVSKQWTLQIAALVVCAVPLAAQVTTRPDSARRTTIDSTPRVMTSVDSGRALLMRPRASLTERVDMPAANQARGVDAEIRVALFELLADQAVPALRRLQWLASSPVALSDSASAGSALRGRRDLNFLLAEAQYRFGMDSAFQQTAQPLLGQSLPPKYTSLLQSQMLLAAYRTGDYPRVIQLANSASDPASRGLASLVSGLASYQLRNYTAARTSFAAARQAGGPYAQYAQYMDVLTSLRGDTTQSAAALGQLQQLATTSTGEFADQVRLTAAQLAYERNSFDQAIQFADGVSPNGGYAAPAQLTKAWAQYKGDKIADAGQSFAAFADRYPQLPERDEARLMAAQTLLQLGKTADAGHVFAVVADSATAEARSLQAGAQNVMRDAARALVTARKAGLLFVQDPATGKTVVLQDRAGADPALLAMAVSDTITVAPSVATTQLLSLNDVRARFDSVNGLSATFPRRVLFTPAAATGGRQAYGSGIQALYAADVAIALARQDLEQQLRAHEMQVALLKQLQNVLKGRRDTLMLMSAALDQNQVAMNNLMAQLDAAQARIVAILSQQATFMRDAASENARVIDSLRTALGTNVTPEDQGTLALESQTVAAYRRTADMLLPRMDSLVRHHPVLALRDTVRHRGDSVRTLLTQAQSALATTEGLVNGELARMQQEPEAVTRLRGAIAEAELRRQTAEARLVAAVDTELRARATELMGDLQRHTEAAEFGKASASFFQALDENGKASGATGTTGAASSKGSPVAAAVTTPPPSKKQ